MCTGTLINDRDSPAREIQNIAKKRAMERRERERLREQSKPRKKEFSLLSPIYAYVLICTVGNLKTETDMLSIPKIIGTVVHILLFGLYDALIMVFSRLRFEMDIIFIESFPVLQRL